MEKPALELFTNVTFVKRDEGGGCLGVLEDKLGRGSGTGWIFPGLVFFHPASTVCTNNRDTTETAGFIIGINCREGLSLSSVFGVTNSDAQGVSSVPPSIPGGRGSAGPHSAPCGYATPAPSPSWHLLAPMGQTSLGNSTPSTGPGQGCWMCSKAAEDRLCRHRHPQGC